jgi:hypothetical protein
LAGQGIACGDVLRGKALRRTTPHLSLVHDDGAAATPALTPAGDLQIYASFLRDIADKSAVLYLDLAIRWKKPYCMLCHWGKFADW